MADKTSSDYFEEFIMGMAKSLAESDPDANRITSRTSAEGDSETYASPNEMLLSAQKAIEMSDMMQARANRRSFFRPIKVTRN